MRELNEKIHEKKLTTFFVLALVASLVIINVAGQVRRGRRGGGGTAHGTVIRGEAGKEAAVGRHGAVVKGDEGYAAVGRHSVVVGERYEDFEAWKAFAAVGTTIAIGTMLARPPAPSTTIAVGGTTYWYYDNAYYSRVYSGGDVAYQVVAPPPGAIITTLPAGCSSARVGNVTYQNCGGTYYQCVSNGYQVLVIK